jgi:hypothetical protein
MSGTNIRRRLKLESSNIAAVGYDPVSQMMEIVFVTDPTTIYRYAGISAQHYTELLNADSIGSFFGKSIRPFAKKYPFVKYEAKTGAVTSLGSPLMTAEPTAPISKPTVKERLQKSMNDPAVAAFLQRSVVLSKRRVRRASGGKKKSGGSTKRRRG